MYTEALSEKIEQYLSGAMDNDQKSRFESEMHVNPEIKTMVEAHRKADTVISYALNKDRKEQLKRLDVELDQELSQNKIIRTATISPMWRKVAVAASVIIAMALVVHFWYQDTNSPQTIADAYFVEVTHQLRGDQDRTSPYLLMENAATAFENKKYDQAIEYYNEVIEGNSLLLETASLNKALTLLSASRENEAQLILEKIASDPEHQHSEAAQKIITKLFRK